MNQESMCKSCTPESHKQNLTRAQLLLKSLETLLVSDVCRWTESIEQAESHPHLVLRAARKDFLTVLGLLGFIPSCPAVGHLPLSDRRPESAVHG